MRKEKKPKEYNLIKMFFGTVVVIFAVVFVFRDTIKAKGSDLLGNYIFNRPSEAVEVEEESKDSSDVILTEEEEIQAEEIEKLILSMDTEGKTFEEIADEVANSEEFKDKELDPTILEITYNRIIDESEKLVNGVMPSEDTNFLFDLLRNPMEWGDKLTELALKAISK